MIEKFFRPRFQLLCADPIARILSRFLSPTLITLFGLFFGICAAVLIVFKSVWLSLFFLTLSGLADILDGSVARLLNKASPFGTVLDIISDRVVEAALIIGLYAYAPTARGLLALLMMGSVLLCVTSFLVVGIFSENESEKSFYYSPGLMERGEAFLFFALMLLFPSLFTWLATLFSALVLLTAAVRVKQFARLRCHGR